MLTLGEVESLIEDVHSSLINLENLVDEGKAQEIHVDEKFRLALYKERKHAEFETCKCIIIMFLPFAKFIYYLRPYSSLEKLLDQYDQFCRTKQELRFTNSIQFNFLLI